MSHIMAVLARRVAEPHTDERGEVNVSMIAWMVVSALVIFAFRTQLEAMLTSAAGFVTTTLGI
ncbi:MAG TPA: hypothetical protein VJA46_05935 [Acidimicrobiia bacterium]|nr:hypothetical protein [Acidimicrobiia bacterium]